MTEPEPGGRRWGVGYVLVLAFTLLVQCLVLLATFFMGLGWGGWSWFLALWLAVAGVLAAALLGVRHSRWVVVVPVASALVTWGLFVAGNRYAEQHECSDAELAAVADVSPPPGLSLPFEGDMVNGCTAHAVLDRPASAVLEHYRSELSRQGWRVTGVEASSVRAEKDGIALEVGVEDVEGGSVVVSVWDLED